MEYEHQLSVAEMCASLAWTVQDLSREARVSWQTAKKIYDGAEPAERTKQNICSAFSRGFNRHVLPGEIAWNVS